MCTATAGAAVFGSISRLKNATSSFSSYHHSLPSSVRGATVCRADQGGYQGPFPGPGALDQPRTAQDSPGQPKTMPGLPGWRRDAVGIRIGPTGPLQRGTRTRTMASQTGRRARTRCDGDQRHWRSKPARPGQDQAMDGNARATTGTTTREGRDQRGPRPGGAATRMGHDQEGPRPGGGRNWNGPQPRGEGRDCHIQRGARRERAANGPGHNHGEERDKGAANGPGHNHGEERDKGAANGTSHNHGEERDRGAVNGTGHNHGERDYGGPRMEHATNSRERDQEGPATTGGCHQRGPDSDAHGHRTRDYQGGSATRAARREGPATTPQEAARPTTRRGPQPGRATTSGERDQGGREWNGHNQEEARPTGAATGTGHDQRGR
jgi:hypothetical protein